MRPHPWRVATWGRMIFLWGLVCQWSSGWPHTRVHLANTNWTQQVKRMWRWDEVVPKPRKRRSGVVLLVAMHFILLFNMAEITSQLLSMRTLCIYWLGSVISPGPSSKDGWGRRPGFWISRVKNTMKPIGNKENCCQSPPTVPAITADSILNLGK